MTVFSQKEGNIWYFGDKAGLDFNGNKPKALTDGTLSTTEGCACISNKNGKLLFYTDGITVWNRNHQVMDNGTGLLGDPSSSQSGVIVPAPGKDNIYYVFTIGLIFDNNGFQYSLVDMTKNNGEGAIISKNNPILKNVTERITAVRHRNNKDMWIITHLYNSDAFYAYLLTEQGLSENPVISKTGMVHEGGEGYSIGLMKSSPDGTNLALAIRDAKKFELFDFDNKSGKISNPIEIKVEGVTYGVEFSPDGSLLYLSAGSDASLYQLNMHAGSPEKIIASKYQVSSALDSGWSGALQVGPDGKIYFTIYQKGFLGVINNPNEVGNACNYVYEGISLGGNKGQLGLPTFIQSYFDQKKYATDDEIVYFDDNMTVESGKKIILNNILFQTNKSTIQQQSYSELNKVVKLLNDKPNAKIELLGHTDNVGNKSYNLKLSLNRAKSVGRYLINKGISTDRISYNGYGSSKPIVNNSTEEGRAKNRRVEFILR